MLFNSFGIRHNQIIFHQNWKINGIKDFWSKLIKDRLFLLKTFKKARKSQFIVESVFMMMKIIFVENRFQRQNFKTF
jgi:hypothetical protein